MQLKFQPEPLNFHKLTQKGVLRLQDCYYVDYSGSRQTAKKGDDVQAVTGWEPEQKWKQIHQCSSEPATRWSDC